MTLTRRVALVQLAGLSAVVAAASARSSTAAEAFTGGLAARLHAEHVPGLSWALITDGQLLHSGAWGFADLASQRPMRADTLVSTASVTKAFTGALLMQFCEQGRCALDDAADRHLPFRLRHPSQMPITLRHLLTHTSGLADDSHGYQASYACGDPQATLSDWLRARLDVAQPPFHADAPGQRHAYSNVGYGLLGLVLEGLGGKPYEALLRERLLTPLDMVRSRVLLRGLKPDALATGYAHVPPGKSLNAPADRLAQGAPIALPSDAGQHQALCHYGFATVSDGLLRSSAAELARFALALLHGGALEGKRVLRAKTIEQMFGDQLVALPAPMKPERYQQGLTWRGLGEGVWAHFGTDPGAAAALALRLKDGRGLAMLANSSRARPLLSRFVAQWMAG
jgi:CubicO group peptidase (beta-lactamase class C family)